ncbi:MAG TPA: radical SAM protein [Chitinivibrionales bacterium]|nr:radical SAM protein [Chitinivibrionales bacterium]
MTVSVFNLLHTRILSHYESAKNILAHKMPAPRTAIVYPTYVCNQACPGCEYQDDNRNIATMMSKKQLFSVVDQLAKIGVKGVEFCGGGEPTLNPYFGEALLRLRKKGISAGLLTNGTNLSGRLAEIAVKTLSYIRISLDAATAETYAKVKRPKSGRSGFDAVIANIKTLVRLRKKYRSKVTLSVKFLVSMLNEKEIEKAAALANRLCVDSLQFKSVRIFKSLGLGRSEEKIQARITRLADKYPRLSVVGSVRRANITMKCWLSPVQIMIDALGDVFICCYYRHRKKTHCFGNLFKQPLSKIWYSKRHWDAIKNIKVSECNVLDCRFGVYNELMHQMMIKDIAQLDFI